MKNSIFRFTLGLLLTVSAFSITRAAAAQDSGVGAPEKFPLKLAAYLGRCEHDKKTGVDDPCVRSPDSVNETTEVILNACNDQDFNGKNCSGSWKKTLAIDGFKYSYEIFVKRYYTTIDFKYLVVIQIHRGKSRRAASLHLKDTTLPSQTWVNPNSFFTRKGTRGYFGVLSIGPDASFDL